ncbi:hypothetical protein WJX74_004200 [Apatococcus lobatus]|uniref:Uncharacterized protein n=1 Tax=Apatococcus lobatus TaxID=904363 RepID=A0AAW1RI84_9CHLO
MLGGFPSTAVGGVRMLQIGNDCLVEQLGALNDHEHFIGWHVVSHPQSSNPFPGAYLNGRVKLTCESVSTIHQTLVKLEVSFLTKFQSTDSMRSCIRLMYESMLESLSFRLTQPSASLLAVAALQPEILADTGMQSTEQAARLPKTLNLIMNSKDVKGRPKAFSLCQQWDPGSICLTIDQHLLQYLLTARPLPFSMLNFFSLQSRWSSVARLFCMSSLFSTLL